MVNSKDKAVILLLDCGNQQSHAAFRFMTEVARHFISMMQAGQRFNVLAFGSSVIQFSEVPVTFTDRTRRAANQFVDFLPYLGDRYTDRAMRRPYFGCDADEVAVFLLTNGLEPEETVDTRITLVRLDLTTRSVEFGGLSFPMPCSDPEPAGLPDLPKLSRFVAHDTPVFMTRKRGDIERNPALLLAQWDSQAFSIGGLRQRAAEAGCQWQVELCDQLDQVLSESRSDADDRMTYHALTVLANIGGESWEAYVGTLPEGFNLERYLEIRTCLLGFFIAWCQQEAVHRPSYFAEDIPEFLRIRQ